MSNKSLTKCAEWKELEKHHSKMKKIHMRDLFADDPQRFDKFSIKIKGLLLDYSKHLITQDTVARLVRLAKARGVEARRDQMFAGKNINVSENRAVLHVALRNSTDSNLEADGENVAEFVNSTLDKISALADKIRSEKKFTDIVNIGIGGSDLGPHMVCEALKSHANGPNVHFISNIDGAHISQVLAELNPKSTLFIIASKTFTTLETMANAGIAREWIGKANISDHFIAVTCNEKAAIDFGIRQENILPMREWIGGRYSVWSAIGLPIAIANGFDAFKDFLAGAHEMDKHFLTENLEQNMPVILALLGVWHQNFCDHKSHGIFPYSQALHKFPAYIQQMEMESNGKNVDIDGQNIDYETSPVIFGETGTNAQHAFFQMLHQGTDIVPCDFIAAVTPDNPDLLANMLAQSKALMEGRKSTDSPYRKFEGNRPSSTLLLDRLDAYHLGMLIALYEHKIFVQGCIWNINSFDQWGVELGKELAKNITKTIDSNEETDDIDSSTQNLIRYLQANKGL